MGEGWFSLSPLVRAGMLDRFWRRLSGVLVSVSGGGLGDGLEFFSGLSGGFNEGLILVILVGYCYYLL